MNLSILMIFFSQKNLNFLHRGLSRGLQTPVPQNKDFSLYTNMMQLSLARRFTLHNYYIILLWLNLRSLPKVPSKILVMSTAKQRVLPLTQANSMQNGGQHHGNCRNCNVNTRSPYCQIMQRWYLYNPLQCCLKRKLHKHSFPFMDALCTCLPSFLNASV